MKNAWDMDYVAASAKHNQVRKVMEPSESDIVECHRERFRSFPNLVESTICNIAKSITKAR
jgi:hypothetical protein